MRKHPKSRENELQERLQSERDKNLSRHQLDDVEVNKDYVSDESLLPDTPAELLGHVRYSIRKQLEDPMCGDLALQVIELRKQLADAHATIEKLEMELAERGRNAYLHKRIIALEKDRADGDKAIADALTEVDEMKRQLQLAPIIAKRLERLQEDYERRIRTAIFECEWMIKNAEETELGLECRASYSHMKSAIEDILKPATKATNHDL